LHFSIGSSTGNYITLYVFPFPSLFRQHNNSSFGPYQNKGRWYAYDKSCSCCRMSKGHRAVRCHPSSNKIRESPRCYPYNSSQTTWIQSKYHSITQTIRIDNVIAVIKLLITSIYYCHWAGACSCWQVLAVVGRCLQLTAETPEPFLYYTEVV